MQKFGDLQGDTFRMAKLRINLACGIYDRTYALADGTIQPEGVELNFISLGPAELFSRMAHNE